MKKKIILLFAGILIFSSMSCFASEKTVIDNIHADTDISPEKNQFDIYYAENGTEKVFSLPKNQSYCDWELESISVSSGDIDNDGIAEMAVNVYYPNNIVDTLCYTCVFKYGNGTWNQIALFPDPETYDHSFYNCGAEIVDGQLVWDFCYPTDFEER